MTIQRTSTTFAGVTSTDGTFETLEIGPDTNVNVQTGLCDLVGAGSRILEGRLASTGGGGALRRSAAASDTSGITTVSLAVTACDVAIGGFGGPSTLSILLQALGGGSGATVSASFAATPAPSPPSSSLLSVRVCTLGANILHICMGFNYVTA